MKVARPEANLTTSYYHKKIKIHAHPTPTARPQTTTSPTIIAAKHTKIWGHATPPLSVSRAVSRQHAEFKYDPSAQDDRVAPCVRVDRLSAPVVAHRPRRLRDAPAEDRAGPRQPAQAEGACSGCWGVVIIVLTELPTTQLPCNSGISLERVEADKSMQQAVETLVELSKDSLDMIAWALTELLDRLAKVRLPLLTIELIG